MHNSYSEEGATACRLTVQLQKLFSEHIQARKIENYVAFPKGMESIWNIIEQGSG